MNGWEDIVCSRLPFRACDQTLNFCTNTKPPTTMVLVGGIPVLIPVYQNPPLTYTDLSDLTLTSLELRKARYALAFDLIRTLQLQCRVQHVDVVDTTRRTTSNLNRCTWPPCDTNEREAAKCSAELTWFVYTQMSLEASEGLSENVPRKLIVQCRLDIIAVGPRPPPRRVRRWSRVGRLRSASPQRRPVSGRGTQRRRSNSSPSHGTALPLTSREQEKCNKI